MRGVYGCACFGEGRAKHAHDGHGQHDAEIIETFGAPNITTVDGNGQEMWVYDRQATVSSSSSSGFSIGMLLGAGGDGVAGGTGLGFSKRKAKAENSSRSMTLIIKFDNRKIVSDFKSRSSSF
jgi:hypothetical protein